MTAFLFFVVALLYSAVGHGGASGYLAILSFTNTPPDQMATTALILNLLVAGISFLSYWRSGHFSLRLTWPFIIASIPTAFLGGMLHVPLAVYELLLAFMLIAAAIRMSIAPSQAIDIGDRRPPLPVSLAMGGAIGFISGIVGVGGGIFLSPIMLIMHWADPKKTSATSAAFIIVNALSGLAGRASRNGLQIGDLTPLLVAGLLGAMAGSYLGAARLPGIAIRRVLAIVLFIAAIRLATHAFA